MVKRPRSPRNSRVITLAALMVGILGTGTLGYMMLEGWPFFESFYMTIITLSTVGYGEVRALSPQGRMFTAMLISGGALSVGLLLGAIGQSILSAEISGTFRRRRVDKAVSKLRDHFIVCGEGRVGRQVGWDLRRQGEACVMIEPEFVDKPGQERDHLVIAGDAEDDLVLERAGVYRARGLVAVTGDDPTNMFITMSAKAMNEELVVVARANFFASEAKLRRAGADHVISPYMLSGQRIASMLVSPSLTEFVDELTAPDGRGMKIGEFSVPDDSPILGNDSWLEAARATGAIVLGWRPASSDSWCTTMTSSLPIGVADRIVAVGQGETLHHLQQLIGASDSGQERRFRRRTAPTSDTVSPTPTG